LALAGAENMLMDRADITVMVEDFWRSFIPIAFNGDQRTATMIVERFQKQIDDMAKAMPATDAAQFNQMVEEERDRLFKEYNANPARMKARLGVPDGFGAESVAKGPRSNRMGLGELAVRTTVRATVWESVTSLFRLFR
jgi:hypothetical protein